eukprot:s6917_g1.t1
MPSLYNKMQNCEAVAADGPTAAEQKPNSSHNNFPGGLWIDGVRVDVAGRIAPHLAGAKPKPQSDPSRNDPLIKAPNVKAEGNNFDFHAMD